MTSGGASQEAVARALTGEGAAETCIAGAGGTALRARIWPAASPRGRVLVVHGLGEHAGRYQPLAETLAGRGWSVLVYDQRGHGRSQGRKGHVGSFDLFVEDLAIVQGRLDALLPGPGRPFLYGHSMGGLVLLRYLQTRAPAAQGAVLSAPWFATLAVVPLWKQWMARLLRWTTPWVRVPTGLDPTRLTRDPARQESYLADPYVGRGITVKLWDAVAAAQAAALGDGVPDVPLLLLLPGDDPVADAGVAAAWARGGAVTTLDLPGFRHEPHNELGREGVFQRVADWLEATRAAPAG